MLQYKVKIKRKSAFVCAIPNSVNISNEFACLKNTINIADKGLYSQSYAFSGSHVWM